MYGHVKALVDAAAEGARKTGVDVHLMRVPEVLSDDILEKMGAKGLQEVHSAGVPVVDRATWHNADGFIFAAPTRYGMMAGQMKMFFDGTGHLWANNGLVGKAAGFITSTATQNGGQETTHLTTITQLAHHGMVYVPCGYTFPQLQFDLTEAHGGSPYGPSTLAGPKGERHPTEKELAMATHYGEVVANTVKALHIGRAMMLSGAGSSVSSAPTTASASATRTASSPAVGAPTMQTT